MRLVFGRAVAPDLDSWGCRGTPKVRRRLRGPYRSRGRDMSGSEIERETIVTEMLSATADSKPADRELHTWPFAAEGFDDPSLEKYACGVGFIANIKATKSHQIVADALQIASNLEHPFAVGADPG